MKLIEFINQFPDEESCRSRFKQYRDIVGVVCPHCGCRVHYWSGGKSQRYECKCCGYRQSLRANTVLHNSKLSFRTWFIAMHLMTSTKGNLSALEIQRQLGMKNYRPVWRMVNKLRNAMGHDDDQYKLNGEVEIDEAFFKLEPTIPGKREHLTDVLVVAESEKVESSKHRIKSKLGHIKMKVIQNTTSSEIFFTAQKYVAPGAVMRSDGAKAHNLLKRIYEVDGKVYADTAELMSALPWVHINIGHSKNQIRDVYHAVKEEYLQLYLDEFCWKKNHRYEDKMDRLIRICAKFRIGWFPIDHKFSNADMLRRLGELGVGKRKSA